MIAFGDGDNDKEMLAAAGHGVAMVNGHVHAKSSAKDVTEVCYCVFDQSNMPWRLLEFMLCIPVIIFFFF